VNGTSSKRAVSRVELVKSNAREVFLGRRCQQKKTTPTTSSIDRSTALTNISNPLTTLPNPRVGTSSSRCRSTHSSQPSWLSPSSPPPSSQLRSRPQICRPASSKAPRYKCSTPNSPTKSLVSRTTGTSTSGSPAWASIRASRRPSTMAMRSR
jgi:hypothetical protein